HLKVMYDPNPNAFALGRHTICVTEGLFDLPDEMIEGILAHELDFAAVHISNADLGGLRLRVPGCQSHSHGHNHGCRDATQCLQADAAPFLLRNGRCLLRTSHCEEAHHGSHLVIARSTALRCTQEATQCSLFGLGCLGLEVTLHKGIPIGFGVCAFLYHCLSFL
ncbi:MAG: M48 family metalloprotease, partial [Bacteroidaceae bacterium]|nr:M48 family metalloprotease [Bacteroidaceae bacterium]